MAHSIRTPSPRTEPKAARLVVGLLLAAGGTFLTATGLMVFAVGLMPPLLIVVLLPGAAAMFFGMYFLQTAGKGSRRTTPSRPNPSQVRTRSRSFSPNDPGHQHIVPVGLSQAGRLDQLETLRKAGLYTDQEYRAARDRILNH